jgi:hypothetical protein
MISDWPISTLFCPVIFAKPKNLLQFMDVDVCLQNRQSRNYVLHVREFSSGPHRLPVRELHIIFPFLRQ